MKKTILIIFLALIQTLASADVIPAGIIGSNMVLQRNADVKLWGKADSNAMVSVTTSWNGKKYKVKSDNDGNWCVAVKTTEAGGPYTIRISDGKELLLENVLLGEVWICSGQSNMEMPVCGFMYQPVDNAAEHILSAADYPGIRLFQVPRVSMPEIQETCGGNWETSSPASVSKFSATGYFFGKTLYKALGGNVPVGLIEADWGGSYIETWMTEETLEGIDGLDMAFCRNLKDDNSAIQRLYNAMIHPIHNFTAKGFIWYQGESNRANWYDYKKLMVALVRSWRTLWDNEDMPFYYVQLAPYNYEGADRRSLALVIEAQYQAMAELPHTGIAATTDLGNPTGIHPQRKLEVGQRLAFLALANDYGIKGLPRPAPTFKSMEFEDDERRGRMAVINFNNVSGKWSFNEADSFKGYLPEGYCTPAGFELAGSDKVFHPARANYKWWENRIEVWSSEVPEPIAVRYAFKNYPKDANVVTTLGQPLAPFRTDDWEIIDF